MVAPIVGEEGKTQRAHPGVRVVECHVEALSKGDTCCACGGRGARPAKPVLARAYHRDSRNAAEWPGRIALCEACVTMQHREELRERRRRLLAWSAVFAALVAVFVPRAPSFAVVVTSAIALQLLAWIAHEAALRGARVPATVLSCEGDEMRVQLLDRAAQTSDAPIERGDYGVRSGWVFTAFALAAIALAYPLWAAANPEVTIVSRLSDGAEVLVDGRRVRRVLPSVSEPVRLAFGAHRLTFVSDPALPPLEFRSSFGGETSVRLALPDCEGEELDAARPRGLRWRRDSAQGYLLDCEPSR